MSTPTRAQGREYVLKFVLVGDSNVGKSQLALRFCKIAFDPESSTTIGMEFATKVWQLSS
jgi:GTPase SAR1 family protein